MSISTSVLLDSTPYQCCIEVDGARLFLCVFACLRPTFRALCPLQTNRSRSASTCTSTRQQVDATCRVPSWWILSQEWVMMFMLTNDTEFWQRTHLDVCCSDWCLESVEHLWGEIEWNGFFMLQAPWTAFVPDPSANCSAQTTLCSVRQVLEITGQRPGLRRILRCFHVVSMEFLEFYAVLTSFHFERPRVTTCCKLSGSLHRGRWVDWLCSGCCPKRSWGLWLLAGIPTLPLAWRRHWCWHGNAVDLQSARGISRSHHGNIFCDPISKGVRHSGGALQCILVFSRDTFGFAMMPQNSEAFVMLWARREKLHAYINKLT